MRRNKKKYSEMIEYCFMYVGFLSMVTLIIYNLISS